MHSFFLQRAELGSLISKRKDQKKREKQMANCIFLVLFMRNPLKSGWSVYLLYNCSVWHRADRRPGIDLSDTESLLLSDSVFSFLSIIDSEN